MQAFNRWIRSEPAIATMLYFILSLIFTYPFVLAVSNRILGDGDAWLFPWNMWWMRFALRHGMDPFFTDYIYFPTGVSAYLHTWNFPITLAAIPLQSLLSPVTLYNLYAWSSFVLAGLGMYRLACFLGVRSVGAIVSGVAFSFSPYHFAHALGHLNLMSYQWIPFFLVSFLQGIRDGWSRRRVSIATAWLLLVALTDWYFLVFCLFAILILVATTLIRNREHWRRLLWGSGKVVFLTLVIVSPLLLGMFRQSTTIPAENLTRVNSSDLLSFIIPGPISTFGDWFSRWNSNWMAGPAELGTFIPWSVLLISLCGWAAMSKRNRHWLSIWIGTFLVLSLGPYLHVGGTVYEHFLLPYGWIEKLPGFDVMRAPIRFHLMTYLGVCLVYGAGVNFLTVQRKFPAMAAPLAALVLVESLSVPLTTASRDISPFYEDLKSDPKDLGVIDLHYSSRALFYQTVHERRIVGRPGMLSRSSTDASNFLRETPVIRQLTLENELAFFSNGWPDEALKEAVSALGDSFTLVAVGQALGSGELEVETRQPHELWINDSQVGNGDSSQSSVILRSGERALVRVQVSLNKSDLVMREPVFRLLLDDRDPTANPTRSDNPTPLTIEPIAGPDIESEGLTCLFYTNVAEPLEDSQEAIGSLIKLGFGWIVVPFYGTDHFIRNSLQLEPFYEDRWLRAYQLGR